MDQRLGTHSRSPSVKVGCRSSSGNKLTNETPMLRKTSAMSCKLGTHTSNFVLLFSTTTHKQQKPSIHHLVTQSIFKSHYSIPICWAADKAIVLMASRICAQTMGFGWTDIICHLIQGPILVKKETKYITSPYKQPKKTCIDVTIKSHL